jgi:outer membrane protein TolC
MVILNLFLGIALAAEAPLILTQKKVAELVLKQSLRAQEINLSVEKTRLDLVEVYSFYDFKFEGETGYEQNRFENYFGTQNIKDETITTNLNLSKSLPTGTTLGLGFTRTSIKSEFQPAAVSTYPNLTTDVWGLTLKQSLWKNYFGTEFRKRISASEKINEAEVVGRINQQQDLVLDAIAHFWKTYVSQENFKEAMNSRERYTKLVQAVRKKSGYGYTAAGELARAQAELEQKEQAVKKASVDYLRNLDNLLALLNLPVDQEVKFEVTEAIPALPKIQPVDFAKLRQLKAAELRMEAQKDFDSAAEAGSGADVSLIGKMFSQGLDDSAEGAWGEGLQGKSPQYYVGVSVEYGFGSGLDAEKRLNGRLSRMLAENQFKQTTARLKNNEAHLQRQLQAAYAIAMSSRTQKELREKAAQEINRSYNQGRTDISQLIEALNSYFTSEIAYSSAVGDYQIALNQWAAFNEELVTDSGSEK